MINILGKCALFLLAVYFLSTAPVFADSTTTFTFTGTVGNIGTTSTFTAGSLSLIATGYSAPGITVDMFAKSDATQMGLGLVNDIFSENEISGGHFIQLNLSNILAASPSSIAISMQSVTGADRYAIWGSNAAGMMGTLLATDLTAASFTLPDLGMFQYISISAPAGNVLLHDVDVSTPEPGSASLLLLGFIALVGAGTLGKKLVA